MKISVKQLYFLTHQTLHYFTHLVFFLFKNCVLQKAYLSSTIILLFSLFIFLPFLLHQFPFLTQYYLLPLSCIILFYFPPFNSFLHSDIPSCLQYFIFLSFPLCVFLSIFTFLPFISSHVSLLSFFFSFFSSPFLSLPFFPHLLFSGHGDFYLV